MDSQVHLKYTDYIFLGGGSPFNACLQPLPSIVQENRPTINEIRLAVHLA